MPQRTHTQTLEEKLYDLALEAELREIDNRVARWTDEDRRHAFDSDDRDRAYAFLD